MNPFMKLTWQKLWRRVLRPSSLFHFFFVAWNMFFFLYIECLFSKMVGLFNFYFHFKNQSNKHQFMMVWIVCHMSVVSIIAGKCLSVGKKWYRWQYKPRFNKWAQMIMASYWAYFTFVLKQSVRNRYNIGNPYKGIKLTIRRFMSACRYLF